MKIIRSIAEMQTWTVRAKRLGQTIGFVPTMGALHKGHMALVRRAYEDNDLVVVSIFVNPLQFGPKEDLRRYPRTLKQDLSLLQREKTAAVFVPADRDLVPERATAQISVPKISRVLEGEFRPGHFEGVATIVGKLFNIVQPHRAYFGEKDYQQLCVIRRMVKDLNWPVQLVSCPTIRDYDGLALSSRNRYLSRAEREEAVKLYQSLYLGRELVTLRVFKDAEPLVQRLTAILKTIPKSHIDYVAVVDPATLEPMKKIRRPVLLAVAVRIGKTRLIDNVVIP